MTSAANVNIRAKFHGQTETQGSQSSTQSNRCVPFILLGAHPASPERTASQASTPSMREPSHRSCRPRVIDCNSIKALGYATVFPELDADGFVKAFEIANIESVDWEAIDHFFDQHGFVVVRGVYPEEQIDDTIDEMWSLISRNSVDGGQGEVDRDNPATWEDNQWVGNISGRGDNRGFVDLGDNPFSLKAYWNNYQNKVIVGLFQHLFGNDDITFKESRFGCMRPTCSIPTGDGRTVDRPDWRTTTSWLHWDINPWDQPGLVGIQGILALSDSTVESGGFTCVPGFNREIAQWVDHRDRNSVPGNKRFQVSLPKDCPEIENRSAAIPVRKGDFIAWDSRLPHANFPNNGSMFRMCQYIEYGVIDPAEQKVKANEMALRMLMADDVSFQEIVTPLGRKVLSLDLADPFDETDKAAAMLVKKAIQAEVNGDQSEAMKLYSRAFRMSPKLETLV